MGQDQISNSERGGTPARARNRVWSHGKRQKGVLDVGEMGSEMTGNNDLDVDLKDKPVFTRIQTTNQQGQHHATLVKFLTNLRI